MRQKNYCEFVEAANRASGRAISKIKARVVFAQAVLLSTERNKRWLGPQFKASNACTTLIIQTSLKKYFFLNLTLCIFIAENEQLATPSSQFNFDHGMHVN
jgi:hypothetical protein